MIADSCKMSIFVLYTNVLFCIYIVLIAFSPKAVLLSLAVKSVMASITAAVMNVLPITVRMLKLFSSFSRIYLFILYISFS